MASIASKEHYKAPANLNQLVEDKYKDNLAKGNLVFTDTESKTVKNPALGEKYWVTYAPSLNHKPERSDEPTKNPFEDPEPELTVVETVNDDYRLVLNKFPIIPNHLLLVTKEFKSQNSPLTPKDLYTAYKLVQALDPKNDDDGSDSDSDDDDDQGTKRAPKKRHVVFYNCGPNSGSSVDHKHLQILELPSKLKSFQDKLVSANPEPYLPNLAKEPLQNDKLGFSHFVVPLPNEKNYASTADALEMQEYLAMCFASLLQRTLSFFQQYDAEDETKVLPLSYNFIMTQDWMCLVPRKSAFGEVEVPIAEDEEQSSHNLKLGFNATGYMNMILVKDENSKQKIHSSGKLIDELLTVCAFPNSANYKPDEYDY
ncbi:hypothetical protein ACO0RG_001640 [Hanseniaspora osmophila]|mgnify:CR=1 FL=1|uniref:Diadenosine 5',5'''-P1,P4-tetraphosphate phosphorylase 2 n=1 Tax=Hanseniaspora osmophila TaxID=56408 RepID=A0A1E5RHQ9_9ASCO|nr:Diadenosine 5',5'''-P1,P4-tetraphosphate phosphorylase 2 [Hanseniaspora osmophila]